MKLCKFIVFLRKIYIDHLNLTHFNEDTMKAVGPMFRTYCNLKHIKHKTLAEAIGCSPQQMSSLLNAGAESWKLIYFVKACEFLHIHPKTFFENWNDPGLIVYGNLENSGFFDNSQNKTVTGEDSAAIIEELKNRLKEKDATIASLNELVNLQKIMLNKQNS